MGRGKQPHPGIFEVLTDASDVVRRQVVTHNNAAGRHLEVKRSVGNWRKIRLSRRGILQHRGTDAVMRRPAMNVDGHKSFG